MRLRILDLDGSISTQPKVVALPGAIVHDLRRWGPEIRMASGFRAFARFEKALRDVLGGPADARSEFALYGSGDFHHVSLALARRLTEPVNLLVIDKHPDWMRGVPILHCGTWLHHAGRSPDVRTIFHVGGDLDFDNAYRPLAPWPWLYEGKVRTFPAVRRFRGGGWNRVETEPLRPDPETPLDADRLGRLLEPHRRELASRPLYVSIDKDALREDEAVVNWDSGLLSLDELEIALRGFLGAANGRLAGADSTGDWSPVEVRGALRGFLHRVEHPRIVVDPETARERNERVNLRLLEVLADGARPGSGGG